MTTVKMVPVSKIHYFASDNISRRGEFFKDAVDRADLTRALFPGWDAARGVAGIYPLTGDAEKHQAKKDREDAFLTLGAIREDVSIKIGDKKVSISGADQRSMWAKMFAGKSGDILEASFGGVFAFRRISILLIVNVLREKMGLAIISEIPCEIVEGDAKVRWIRNVCENQKKLEGNRLMEWPEILSAGSKMYAIGCSETVFRTTFKVGTGQKCFAILDANVKFPNLKILDRALSGGLDVQPISKEEMRKLVKEGDETKTGEYIANAGETNKNRPKSANREKIERLRDQSPVTIIKDVASAIVADDFSTLSRYSDRAVAINTAVSAVLAGTQEKVDAITAACK